MNACEAIISEPQLNHLTPEKTLRARCALVAVHCACGEVEPARATTRFSVAHQICKTAAVIGHFCHVTARSPRRAPALALKMYLSCVHSHFSSQRSRVRTLRPMPGGPLNAA